jgi:hypothetical protein
VEGEEDVPPETRAGCWTWGSMLAVIIASALVAWCRSR